MFNNSRRDKYFCVYLFIGLFYISEKKINELQKLRSSFMALKSTTLDESSNSRRKPTIYFIYIKFKNSARYC